MGGGVGGSLPWPELLYEGRLNARLPSPTIRRYILPGTIQCLLGARLDSGLSGAEGNREVGET
jgi:hypothetical protein